MSDTGTPMAGEQVSSNENEQIKDLLGVSATEPWWRRPGVIIAGAALLLIIFVVISRGFGGKETAGFTSEVVQRGDLTITVSATGNLKPTNQVEVGSEQSGIVTTVYVDNNAHVVRGQPLAQLDTARLRDSVVQGEASLAAAEAQLATARSTASQAQATLARQEQVYRISGGRVPSEVELDAAREESQRAQAAIRSAQANVVQTRAALSSVRTNLTKATILSPVTGVVLSRNINPGQTVAASFQAPVLFTIAEDLAQMKLEVKVDEADVGQVKEGETATFTVDAFPGRTFDATIVRVDVGASTSGGIAASAAAGGNVVSYTAVLELKNPDEILRPGMTATADILIAQKRNVLLVPNAALRFSPSGGATGADRGGVASLIPIQRRGAGSREQRQVTIGRGSQQAVYVLGPDGLPQREFVTVGETDGTLTEIVAGDVRAGMKVITGQLASGSGGSSGSTSASRG
ncbi:MAG: efflux RND transporter periplasmic adaptor subunit [Croceibacterium sp.]